MGLALASDEAEGGAASPAGVAGVGWKQRSGCGTIGIVLDLRDLQLFARIADLGSISAAARALDVPKSSTSRALARLEEGLGVRLLQRSTRRLTLTEEGRLLRAHAGRILETVEDATSALGTRRREVTGLLRVSAPYTLGRALLVPLLPGLMRDHPGLRVELELSGRRVDLIAEGVDLALRTGTLTDSGLVARRLAVIEPKLYASPNHLERHGAPADPDALADHPLLDVARPQGLRRWAMRDPSGERVVEVSPVLVVNDPGALRDVVLADAGIAWLPPFVAADDVAQGRLRAVLPGWSLEGAEIHAVFPSRQGLSPKVRLLLDLLVAEVGRVAGAPGPAR